MRDTKSEILYFWFEETQPQQWFQKNEQFDAKVRELFLKTWAMGRDGFFDAWADNADGSLALCVLLDQFPRNMFRGSAESFATDAKALHVAKNAVAKGFDQMVPVIRRRFLYLPYEHSENIEDQKTSVELFSKMKDQDPLGYDYALRHIKVIEEFGRFPHRNAVLGREDTPAEKAYLETPGAGF